MQKTVFVVIFIERNEHFYNYMIVIIFYIDPKLKLAIVAINSSQKTKKIYFLSEKFNKRGYLYEIKSSGIFCYFSNLREFFVQ